MPDKHDGNYSSWNAERGDPWSNLASKTRHIVGLSVQLREPSPVERVETPNISLMPPHTCAHPCTQHANMYAYIQMHMHANIHAQHIHTNTCKMK